MVREIGCGCIRFLLEYLVLLGKMTFDNKKDSVLNIRTIKQVDKAKRRVVLHVPGHAISLRVNERTQRINAGQKIILLYSNTDGRLIACICGWRAYFLNAPLRIDAHQTNIKPSASQFAGLRDHHLDKAVYRLFTLPQRTPGKKR